jgi:hypothetical protein
MSKVFAEAQRLVAAGASVISIAADGTKRPVASWKAFQSRRPTAGESQRWFASTPCGLAIIGGYVSGGPEAIDFDAVDIFDPWCAMVEELAPGLPERLPLSQTSSDGRHVLYRCAIVEGNQKLARGLNAQGRPETLIETRGAGGYAIIPPSPPSCHPPNKPYVMLRGDLAAIPIITAAERMIMLTAARSFNEHVESKRVISSGMSCGPAQPMGKRAERIVRPPADVPRDILATPDPPLPILRRIVEVPVFAPDATLQTTPGYHAGSRTYFSPPPGFTLPPVSDHSSPEELRHRPQNRSPLAARRFPP